MNIKMYYMGKVTKRKYSATIKLTLDTSSNPPKVLDIDYKDDNKLPASKKLKAKKGILVLFALIGEVEETIKMAGFDKILPICSTEKEALQFDK